MQENFGREDYLHIPEEFASLGQYLVFVLKKKAARSRTAGGLVTTAKSSVPGCGTPKRQRSKCVAGQQDRFNPPCNGLLSCPIGGARSRPQARWGGRRSAVQIPVRGATRD